MFAILQIVLQMGWTKILILCEDSNSFLNLAQSLWMQAEKENVQVMVLFHLL